MTLWTRVDAADTTGKYDDNNANSLSLNWVHGVGSDYQGGTLPENTWAALTTANRGQKFNLLFRQHLSHPFIHRRPAMKLATRPPPLNTAALRGTGSVSEVLPTKTLANCKVAGQDRYPPALM